jgi:hypothetical protein
MKSTTSFAFTSLSMNCSMDIAVFLVAASAAQAPTLVALKRQYM